MYIGFIQILQKPFTDFTAQVVHIGQLTEPVKMFTGVRQGCLVCPLLFLVTLDWVTRKAFGSLLRGIQWHLMSKLEDLEYADDSALLSHRLQDMRCKMENLDMAGEMEGVIINAEKTKRIKVVSAQGGGVGIGQQMIEEVDSFQYLGMRMLKFT